MAQYHRHLTDEQEECLRGCTQQGQYDDMRNHFINDTCPFYQIDHTKNSLLYESELWLGWEVPQRFTTRKATLELQLVFFPRQHFTYQELTRDHFTAEYDIRNWVMEHYATVDGGICGRVGDMRWSVGTVPGHYHLNWFVPNRTGSVFFPLAKDQDRINHDTEQMLRFMTDYDSRHGTT